MIPFSFCVLLAFQAPGAPSAPDRQLVADAERGNAAAQLQLGRIYADGLGVPADPARAVALYRRAADQDHAEAQYELGWSYFLGEGVRENDAEGLVWMRKAADQGNVKAQITLGQSYGAGLHSAAKDRKLAVLWLHRAAAQGSGLAARSIAGVLEAGEGPSRDYVLSYAWLNLATTLTAREGLTTYQSDARELAAKMTPAQLAAAAKLIREWRDKAPPLEPVSAPLAAVTRPTAVAWAPPANAVQVGGAVKMPRLLSTVPPTYPEEARLRGASGIVVVEALINTKGEIEASRIVRGIAGLDQAALDAVRQWVYEPTSVGGTRVPVIVILTVSFRP